MINDAIISHKFPTSGKTFDENIFSWIWKFQVKPFHEKVSPQLGNEWKMELSFTILLNDGVI